MDVHGWIASFARSDGVAAMDHLISTIDRNLDEMLVNLGNIVLKLSHPRVTRTREERRALVRSVSQFSCCARASTDPRVRELAAKLQDTVKPQLRLVASR